MQIFLILTGCTEYAISGAVEDNLGTEEDDIIDVGAPSRDTELSPDTGEDDPGDPTEEEPPPADAPVYANTGGELFEVEPTTGARSLIGTFIDTTSGEEITPFVDIAIDLSGRMYGGTWDTLYRIDPTTGLVRAVCELDVDMVALTFTSDGELIAGGDEGINRIDVASCQVTPLVVGGNYLTSGDLVGLPDGYLYWTVEGDSRDDLIRVDPDTGATSYIGNTGYSEIFGLGYDAGELFGFNSYGETVLISSSTAATTLLTSDADVSWYGATTNPVQW